MALKVSKTEFSQRFEREARVIASLNHPNICPLYDVGPDYLVMEYLEGVAGSLTSLHSSPAAERENSRRDMVD